MNKQVKPKIKTIEDLKPIDITVLKAAVLFDDLSSRARHHTLGWLSHRFRIESKKTILNCVDLTLENRAYPELQEWQELTHHLIDAAPEEPAIQKPKPRMKRNIMIRPARWLAHRV